MGPATATATICNCNVFWELGMYTQVLIPCQLITLFLLQKPSVHVTIKHKMNTNYGNSLISKQTLHQRTTYKLNDYICDQSHFMQFMKNYEISPVTQIVIIEEHYSAISLAFRHAHHVHV